MSGSKIQQITPTTIHDSRTLTTSTATSTSTNLAAIQGASFLPWIQRSMEGLWLLMVFLVPLIFFGQDFAISEAQIAYVEVPKVALLRTLAGLMAILWLAEWAIKSRAFQGSFPSTPSNIRNDGVSSLSNVLTNFSTFFRTLADKLRPSILVFSLGSWLRVHPTRWLLLAAVLFFGSTFISTVFSGSFTTSMWGEIPGQDGYSAYTIASYGILFGVIATHLKSHAQLGRLLGAVILMGLLVGLYAISQHFGHDFFNVTEVTGGGTSRVTVFMGNAIFAATVLAMTVPLTLVVAAVNIQSEISGVRRLLSRLGASGSDSVLTMFWASILAAQLLGLMFTFSRGPWSGAVLALAVFLGLVALSMGLRMLIRTGIVVGLAGILSVGFLHWQGSVSIINAGPWLGVLLAIVGLVGTFATLYIINRFGRAVVIIAAVGAAAAIVGIALIVPSALPGRGSPDSEGAGLEVGSAAGLVGQRISSIKTDVLDGFVGGRGTHWKVSWKLIKNRPWFEFDDLSLTWLRPLVGYGPDLFRYTYLLESPAESVGFSPLEPDHAHNFFIHQTVEQGIIGGVASLALFFSAFGIVAHHILRRRCYGNPIYRLLLFGMMAVILGRFLEMMVGVARVSDLTVLWVVFALFAALVRFDDRRQEEAESISSQSKEPLNRRARRRAARASTARLFSTSLIIRLAVLAWVVGGITVVTWQKSINSVRASVAEGQALDHFRNGEFSSSIQELDKAIKLAPGVPSYYNNRAQVFLNYQLRPEGSREPGCDTQNDRPYLVCLGIQSLESNLESVDQQPFNYRARIAAGNAAFNLQLHKSAVQLYADAAGMVPNAWRIRTDLAESLIDSGLYDQGLAELERSLGITGDSEISSTAIFLKGRGLSGLGQFDDATATLKHGLLLTQTSNTAQASLDLLREINIEQGVDLDLSYFERVINENPEDAIAIYLRGLANYRLGNIESANVDIEKSYGLGFHLSEVRANMGYTRLKLDRISESLPDLTASLEADPSSPLFNTYYAELQVRRNEVALALNHLEIASALNPEFGLAYLVRGKLYMALGLEDSAKAVFDSSIGLDLPTAQDYVDRGEIHAFFGEYELAFSDLNEAIRINPDRSKYYNARARTYANMSDFESALADFNAAIQIDPSDSEHFINRGVLFHLLGESKRMVADFELAESLGTVKIPPIDARSASYFAVYTATTSSEEEATQLQELEAERKALR